MGTKDAMPKKNLDIEESRQKRENIAKIGNDGFKFIEKLFPPRKSKDKDSSIETFYLPPTAMDTSTVPENIMDIEGEQPRDQKDFMGTKGAMPKKNLDIEENRQKRDNLEEIGKDAFDLIDKHFSQKAKARGSSIEPHHLPPTAVDYEGKQPHDRKDLPQFGTGEFSESIVQLLEALNRKKDVVCLILSYSMNTVDRARHKRWIQDILMINQRVGDVETLEKRMNSEDASEISSQLTTLLNHSMDDIEAYVPRELFEKMCQKTPEVETTPMVHRDIGIPVPEEILDLAVGFAIDQIFQNIRNPQIMRIGITGRDGRRAISELNHQPQTKKMFDVVIQINASSYSSIEDIEISIAAKVDMPAPSETNFHDHMKDSNFLILLEDVNDRIELYKLGTKWWNLNKFQAIVSTTKFQKVHQSMAVDLEIRLEDHLLSWELFSMNVGEVLHSSCIQHQAVNVVKACCGHLLAIVLMARALKEVKDVRIWKEASHALGLRTPSQMEDKFLFNALAFIWESLGSAKSFVEYCAVLMEREGMDKVHLIQRWIAETLIKTADEGEKIVGDLVNAFLLESSQNGDFLQMRDEIREVLLKMFKSETNPPFLRLGGKKLTKPPNKEAWKEARWMDLMNNKLSELPDMPNCPHLRDLSLQINPYLREIPPLFFERMPALQTLNLSYTRIKTLPPSLFKLGLLRDFTLGGCELLVQLPPEVGKLKNLEVLNLEGTEILYLPVEVENLTNLKCLMVSFCGHKQGDRKNGQSNTMVPQNVISNLVQLVELSIDVNPDDERWNVTVKHIVKEVCSLKQLKALKLYLPEVVLLEEFMGDGTSSSMYLSLVQFRFIVGSYLKRIISRLPLEPAVIFEQQGRHLKYVNGENVPGDFKKALQHATALFLDRHSTVTSLSEFGIENMKKLEFCVMGECNEIRTVIDGADICNRGGKEDADKESVLGSLRYLCVYYMKSLSSIWEEPIPKDCLANLKSLALHTCPQLITVFNLALLQNLNSLEELVVEDCPKIIRLVSCGDHENLPPANFKWYLPMLKKISLHYMPKLVSISSGLQIAPKLEWMSFYGCWSLKTLPIDKFSVNDLKVIIGEEDWWSALKMTASNSGLRRSHYLDSIFVPIERNRDVATQVAEIFAQHKALREDTKPPQQPGSSGSLKDTEVDAGTTSKGKQLYHPAPSPPPLSASYINISIKGTDEVLCSLEEMPDPVRKIQAPKIEDNSSLHEVVADVVSFLENKKTRRIGIWGTVGTGKTTIMQNLNNHKDIAKMFDIVIWLTVSKEWSIKKLQDAIIQRLKLNMKGSVGVKEIAWRISEGLRGKKYLILLDDVWHFINLHEIMLIHDNQESKVVLASRFSHICKAMEAHELIKVKPLSDDEAFCLFEEKLGRSIYFPRIRELAKLVVKECCGLPLLIDKVAGEFRKNGEDVSLWRDGLKCLQRWETTDECMHEVIEFMKFCYDNLDGEKKKASFLYCALFPEEYDIYIDYLLECWRAEGFIHDTNEFVHARDQGHQLLNTLIDLSFLEKSEKRAYCVKMRKMLRNLALKISSATTDSKFLVKPRDKLKEPPSRKEWEQASRISLMDNQLVSLPESLDCGNLSTLFLQGNKELISIPKLFFASMHGLQVLDLHATGISSLPSSVSNLICLRALYLNFCINLKELPSNIKELHYLELLDIRGTKLNSFPIRSLLWLKCLRTSMINFCMQSTTQRQLGSISMFTSLEEFCVDDDCSKQGWDEVVEDVLVEVTALRNLISLQFYFPTVDSLKLFVTRSPAWKKSSPRPFTFQFSVGLQDPICFQVRECFDVPSYNHLALANANGVDLVISELLMRTHTFALINHHGVSTLSDFGIENLDTLLACSVEGCEEIETIINGDGITKGALQRLEYLCIYNLMELKSIWQGTVVVGSLHQLRILTLTKCPKLKKIFSNGMIDKLHYLQHLTVQECHEIEEIIMESDNHGLKPGSLPRLKSLVLLDLPQLRCIWVDDSLEWPSLQSIKIFKCNKLNHLPFSHANATRLKSIEGEESWWETLIWQDDATKKRVQSLCILS